jgi:hypothetical protein
MKHRIFKERTISILKQFLAFLHNQDNDYNTIPKDIVVSH